MKAGFEECLEKCNRLIGTMEEDRNHISCCIDGEMASAYGKMMEMAIEQVRDVRGCLLYLEEMQILS